MRASSPRAARIEPARWYRPARALALSIVGVDCALILISASAIMPDLGLQWWAVAAYNGVLFGTVVLPAMRAVADAHERAAWALLTVAGGFWMTANLIDSFVSFAPAWVSDAAWLALYVPLLLGLMLLVRSRSADRRSVWMDSVIAALAVTALASSFVFDTLARADTGDNLTAIIVNLAFPVADMMLLGVIVSSAFQSSLRTDRSWRLLAAGLSLFLAADFLHLLSVAGGTDDFGSLTDAGWPLAMLAIGWAAWQPSRPPWRAGAGGAEPNRLIVPVTLATVALGLLISDHFSPINIVALTLASAAMALVIVRLVCVFAQANAANARLLARSLTDPVTGLGNSRALHADLRCALDGCAAHESVLVIGTDMNGFKDYNDTFGHPAGDALLERLGQRLAVAVREHGAAYRLGGDEFTVLAVIDGSCDAEPLVERAQAALAQTGDGFKVSASVGHVLVSPGTMSATAALHAADERMYANKHVSRAGSLRQSADVLLAVISARDPQLCEHLRVAGELAQMTAVELGLADEHVARIRLTAELHDIGKVAIPDAILHKRGELSDDERLFVEQHTVIGQRIAAAAPALAAVANLIRSSHERFDGGGYPDGLAGDAIPLGAQVVCVCDAFDAMTSARPYRAALTWQATIAQLREQAGSQFDPVIVEAFAAAYGRRTSAPASAPPEASLAALKA